MKNHWLEQEKQEEDFIRALTVLMYLQRKGRVNYVDIAKKLMPVQPLNGPSGLQYYLKNC